MAKKPRELTAVRYNAGNMLWYRSGLKRMVAAMNKDVRSQVIAIFEQHELAQVEEIAMDAINPVQLVKDKLKELTAKWMARFIKRSVPLATDMSSRTIKVVDRSLVAAAAKDGMTINMQMTDAMTQRVDAIIAENVSLIKSIPEKYFTEVEGMVYRAVSRGNDRKQLVDDLMAGFSKRSGITRRRAVFIANDQVRKATSALSAVRQQAAGITEGVWMHSRGQAHPRRKHVKADGEKFKLSEGYPCGDQGQNVMPGQEINCSCTWKPVAPW